MKFTIGTDTEFPLTIGGQYVSAIPFITGTKEKPQVLECGSILVRDNVACEFATPVAHDETSFVDAVRKGLCSTIRELPKDSLLRAVPAAHFDRKHLEHREAKRIGCEADFNAWTGRRNRPPVKEFKAGTLRSFGAHIHVGHESLLGEQAKQGMIKTMDYLVGMVTVPLDCDAPALERRKLYGKAGCHRPTAYGVEYRTLSNFWARTPDLVALIYNLTHDSLVNYTEGSLGKLMDLVPPVQVHESINNGIKKLAIQGVQKIHDHLSDRSKELLAKVMRDGKKQSLQEAWEI